MAPHVGCDADAIPQVMGSLRYVMTCDSGHMKTTARAWHNPRVGQDTRIRACNSHNGKQ